MMASHSIHEIIACMRASAILLMAASGTSSVQLETHRRQARLLQVAADDLWQQNFETVCAEIQNSGLHPQAGA